MTARLMLNRLIGLKKSVFEIAVAVIQETEYEYLELNRMQLERGFDKKDQRIGEYFVPSYAAYKNRLNPLAGRGNVDLILSGSFVDQMRIDVKPKGVLNIYSQDKKNNDLTAKYGTDIFGLSVKSRQEYVEKHFRKPFINNVRLYLYAK